MLRSGLAAMATIVALAAAAHAEGSLDEARRAVEQSDYLTAREKVTAALSAGTASPEELAEIYRLTGIVEGALGEADAASAAFARWLALDPKGSLPPGTSPKIMRPFTAAQDKVKKRGGLKVKTETNASPPTVTLVVVSDPLALVAGTRVYVRADRGEERTIEGLPGRPTELPDGKRLDVRLVALDKFGNHVVELGSEDVPIVVLGKSGEQKQVTTHRRQNDLANTPSIRDGDRHHPRPLYAKWWVWGAGAVAFGGAATAFGMAARSNASELEHLNATSSAHDFSEAQRVESAARRDALLFNIGVGLAGAAAIGAAILYVTEPKHPSSIGVGAIPANGGGIVSIGGQF